MLSVWLSVGIACMQSRKAQPNQNQWPKRFDGQTNTEKGLKKAKTKIFNDERDQQI